MVMDIRFLRQEEEAMPRQETAPGLEEWLEQAAGDGPAPAQARAVAQLRRLVPSAEGLERLWALVAQGEDGRRLLAAQILGFHREWLASPTALKRLLELARHERDAAVGTALVWALRQREEICEFLGHERGAWAREAALGLPLNRRTLPRLLEVLLGSPSAAMERILLYKLRLASPALARRAVALFLERDWDGAETRLETLLDCLPQLPLFELFLEERRPSAWVAGKNGEAALRSRAWQQLARAAARVLARRPSAELMRYLLGRSGEDETFARRHAGFLQVAIQRAEAGVGTDLLGHLEKLAFRASEDKVARLAHLLVGLAGRLQGPDELRATSLLEDWKNRSAALKLKIYHLQQGLS